MVIQKPLVCPANCLEFNQSLQSHMKENIFVKYSFIIIAKIDLSIILRQDRQIVPLTIKSYMDDWHSPYAWYGLAVTETQSKLYNSDISKLYLD